VLNKPAATFFRLFPHLSASFFKTEFLLPASSPTPTSTRICVLVSTAGMWLTNSIPQASGRGLEHVNGSPDAGLGQRIGQRIGGFLN